MWPPTARPRPTWPCGCTWTTGGGQGCPIYVRTGKRLPARVTEVALQFRQVPLPPLRPAGAAATSGPTPSSSGSSPTRGSASSSGPRSPARSSTSARWPWTSPTPRPSPGTEAADGYERLIHDAMIGDATLFIRSDEVATGLAHRRPLPAGVVGAGRRRSTSTRPGHGARTWPTSWSSGPATNGATRSARPRPLRWTPGRAGRAGRARCAGSAGVNGRGRCSGR